MACQLFRSGGKVEKVLSPDGKPSALYDGIVKYVKKTGVDTIFNETPYLQDRLTDGTILDKSVEEIAVGLWSMHYTPEFQDTSSRMEMLFPGFLEKSGEVGIRWFTDNILKPNSLKDVVTAGYTLTGDKQDLANNEKKSGNKLQNAIVQDLFENPENPVTLLPEEHIYVDEQGEVYTSTTTKIKGTLDDNGKYERNRAWGNAFDALMDNIIQNKSYEEAVAGIEGVDPAILKSTYNTFLAYVEGWRRDGSVVLSQVIVADAESLTAGSIDILVISPEGEITIVDLKSSKNSVKSEAYDKQYPIKASSGTQSVFLGQSLSTRQQHGIQVGVYRKLIELKGYTVKAVETIHLLEELNEDGSAVKSVTWEGRVSHSITANKEAVNKVVPTKVTGDFKNAKLKKDLGEDNPANDPEFLSEDDAKMEDETLTGDAYDKMHNQVMSVVDIMRARREYMEKISKSKTFEEKSDVINRINELLIMIGNELSDDKPSIAYGKFLNYAKRELQMYFDKIADPASMTKDDYVNVLLEVRKHVESYRGMFKIREKGSKDQQRMHSEVTDMLDDLQETVEANLETYVRNLVQKTSSRNLSEADLDSIMTSVYDISMADLNFGDLATSTDTLLAIVDKLYKQAGQQVQDRAESFTERMYKLGAALMKAAGVSKPDGKFYDFMKQMNKAGEWTGRYVQRVGSQYYDMYYKLKNATRDNKGDAKKYIEIFDPATASAEDIQYNIDLYFQKKAFREFQNAETLSAKGAEDGKYHKFTDDFKEARDQFEELIAVEYKEGETAYYWKKKEGIDEDAYLAYKLKYYNKVNYVGAIMDEGVFKGQVGQKTGWFPKNQFVEIRDVAADGMDLRDEKYKKLTNPTTDLERAQGAFYTEFMSSLEELNDKLPPEVAGQMKNKAARVSGTFMAAATAKGAGFAKAVFGKMKKFFQADISSDQRMVDETGAIDKGIPILYVGALQNEKRVEFIKKQIMDLQADRAAGKVNQKDYMAKKKDLNRSLQFEESRIKASEIEGDLIKNILAYGAMVENYDVMNSIEGSLRAIANVMENRTYFKTDEAGNKLIVKGSRETRDAEGNPIIKDANEVFATRRLNKWFKMVFYNNDEYNRTTMGMIAKRIQNFTSLKGIGFNLFGNINNYVMARINNSIEAAGSLYYERAAAQRALMAYNKEYMPGVLTGLGKAKGEYYSEKEPNSKYEAMVSYFRMVKKYQADSGKVDPMSWAYMLQEGGEYNAQSKVGIAILMSRQVTNTKTGETSSIYDAFDFDSNTGQLKIRDGFELSDKDRYDTTNYILEVNKQIHGNYAPEDRMVIQEHWLGQLGAQFHKWVYPAYKVRFKKGYYDENLGIVEGRYATIMNFLAYVRESEGNVTEMLQGGWNTLSEVQKKNMLKNAAELGYVAASFAMYGIFKMIGDGVDDDDKVLKRWVNFMTYQQSRQINELTTMMPVIGFEEQYQLAKSPVAILTTLKEFSQATKATMALPFPPYDKNYYERGVHKGDLKAWKEWKDIIPALAILNKWDAYDQVKSFYIR